MSTAYIDDRVRAGSLHPNLPGWLRELHEAGESSSAIRARAFAGDLSGMPVRWRERIIAQTVRGVLDAAATGAPDTLGAWFEYEKLLARLRAAPARLDCDDEDIRGKATRCARHCARLAALASDLADAKAFPLSVARFMQSHGVAPPAGRRAQYMMGRALDAFWWRRRLRATVARQIEGAAIGMGLVHKRADVYLSEESFVRRKMQNASNAAALANTTATNEWAQEYTLAELANQSTAAQDIRRHELIIRLKGFEEWAARRWHDAQFVTLTCPSKFHAYTKEGAPNPRYQDGITPRDAQAYLRALWARIRAKLARQGVEFYGFRIAEPHGDGTPHWHFVLFSAPRCAPAKKECASVGPPPPARVLILRAFRQYGLAADPSEPGAQEHRVTCVPIESQKGSATGYAIKYISKNIDGFRVGDWKIDADLAGDETLNLAPRVQAWASTWGIRQFQQIGGPRVGLWREFRRVRDVPSDRAGGLSDEFVGAFFAANRWADPRSVDEYGEMQDKRQADFCAFIAALKPQRWTPHLIRLQRDAAIVCNRYGEVQRPKVIGLRDRYREWTQHHGLVGQIVTFTRAGFVPTLRHSWNITYHKRKEPSCISHTSVTPAAPGLSS